MKISRSDLRRLARLERKFKVDRSVGNWVRGRNGALIWDPWDMDAPPEHDPLPHLIEEMNLIRERLQAQLGWTEPTRGKAHVR